MYRITYNVRTTLCNSSQISARNALTSKPHAELPGTELIFVNDLDATGGPLDTDMMSGLPPPAIVWFHCHVLEYQTRVTIETERVQDLPQSPLFPQLVL